MSNLVEAKIRITPDRIPAAISGVRGFFPRAPRPRWPRRPGAELVYLVSSLGCVADTTPEGGVLVTHLASFENGSGYGVFCGLFPAASEGDWVQIDAHQRAVIDPGGWEELDGVHFRLLLDGTEVLGAKGAFNYAKAALADAGVSLSAGEEATNILGRVVGMMLGPTVDAAGRPGESTPPRPSSELHRQIPLLLEQARAERTSALPNPPGHDFP